MTLFQRLGKRAWVIVALACMGAVAALAVGPQSVVGTASRVDERDDRAEDSDETAPEMAGMPSIVDERDDDEARQATQVETTKTPVGEPSIVTDEDDIVLPDAPSSPDENPDDGTGEEDGQFPANESEKIEDASPLKSD